MKNRLLLLIVAGVSFAPAVFAADVEAIAVRAKGELKISETATGSCSDRETHNRPGKLHVAETSPKGNSTIAGSAE